MIKHALLQRFNGVFRVLITTMFRLISEFGLQLMICFSFFQTRQRQHDSSFLGLEGDVSQGFIRLVDEGKQGFITLVDGTKIERAIKTSSESCLISSNKLPRIMFHISYRITLLIS
eukprot:sb/3476655/